MDRSNDRWLLWNKINIGFISFAAKPTDRKVVLVRLVHNVFNFVQVGVVLDEHLIRTFKVPKIFNQKILGKTFIDFKNVIERIGKVFIRLFAP